VAARYTEEGLYNNMLLATLEILVVIVAPLLILYLTGPWPMRIAIPCLMVIPVLWYLTYSPIHELSHVLGTYLVGGSVTELKLIPSFWQGEFGRAWITPQGLRAPWQQLVMTSAPYVLDGLSVAVAFFALHRRRPMRSFALGSLLMLLCLRPAFDVVCETVAFALGGQGDLYHIAHSTGYPMVWLSMTILLGFSLLTIARVLVRSASRGQKDSSHLTTACS
jgi:hypothetical protein